MSARKATRRPKAQAAPNTPRMGATPEQVAERAKDLIGSVFEVAAMLRVCAAAFRDNVAHEDEIADTLKVAARNLNELPGHLERLTWTDDEVLRNRRAEFEREHDGGTQP